MFENNNLPNGSSIQFTMSHEVIAFIRWLAEHHADELKELAKKALNAGLLQQQTSAHDRWLIENDDTHAVMIDFFGILELIMHEALEEYAMTQARQTHLQPTIDQIDGAFCDTSTVKTSLELATTDLAAHPEKSAKELLFKELLKQWRPNNSQPLN